MEVNSEVVVKDDDSSARASLHALLTQTRIGSMPNPLNLASIANGSISMHAFEFLFGDDKTFGQFGMAVPQADSFLNMIAVTAFNPKPDLVTYRQGALVTGVLTPIYRILTMLAILNAIKARFEDFVKISDANIAQVLPYKPHASYTNTRYASLIELTLSVWYEICHAYTVAESPERFKIDELYCFESDRTRAHEVWLDVQVESIVTSKHMTLKAEEEWIVVRKKTFKGPLCIVLIDLQPETFPELAEDEKDIPEIYPNTLCLIKTFNARANGNPGDVPNRCGDESLIRFDKLSSGIDMRKALIFQRVRTAPYISLCNGDATEPYYLLLTHGGGNYSSFYRNDQNGKLISYPLYMHPRTPYEQLQVNSMIEAREMNSSKRDRQRSNNTPCCCVCARERGEFDSELMRNEFDSELGQEYLLYCSRKCIDRMIVMRDKRRKEQIHAERTKKDTFPL